MASIARGLEAGVNIGFKIDEAMRKKRLRDEIEAAQREKPFQKYTPEQAAQMRQQAGMLDEQGRPMYRLNIAPGSIEYTPERIYYPEAPIKTEGLSYGGPAYEEAIAPPPRSREEIARMYAIGTPYDGPVDLKGEPIYSSEAPAVSGGLGRELTARDTGFSRPVDAVYPGPEESDLYKRFPIRLEKLEKYAPGATEYLGKTYGKEGPSQQEMDAALMGKYASIISREDPMEGLKLKVMAQQEQRAGQEFDIKQKISQYQLNQLERGEKQDKAEDKLLEDIKKNRDLLNGDLNKLFAERGIRPERGNKLIEGVLGIENGMLTRMQNTVKKAWMGSKGNLNTFLQSSLDDEDYDPSSHLVQRKGPKGGIIVDTVETLPDKKAGRVLSSTPELPNEAEAMDYLYNMLTNPGAAAQTALKNQETRAKIKESEERAGYFKRRGLTEGDTDKYRDITTLRGVAGEIRQQLDDITREIANAQELPDGKEKVDTLRALTATANRLRKDLRDTNEAIGSGLRGRGLLPERAGGGEPSQRALEVLKSGKNPETGKPLTKEDYDAFKRQFPKFDITPFLPKKP